MKEEELRELDAIIEELKDWQEGTVGKMYDREEEVIILRQDVDRYWKQIKEKLAPQAGSN